MDTQTHSAGGLEQDEHVVEKKPSYMNRVKAKARKIRDSIGSKMQNHDHETGDEDQFTDVPEKVPEVHGEPIIAEHETPEVKTGSDNLNSGTTPSKLNEHRDAETTPREYGEMGAPEPKRYSTQHEHAEEPKTDTEKTEKTKTDLGGVEEPKTDLDVSSTPLEVEKAAVIREIDSRPTLDFDDESSVEVPMEAEKTSVIAELNSTIPRIDSEKPYKWNLDSNSEISPTLEAEKAAVITEINSSITRIDSEKPYTTSQETNFSPVSTPLEADKENAGSTWMDFEKENAEPATDHFGTDTPKVTDLADAGAKEADVEPMTRSFGDIDITGKPEPTGTDSHDKFSFDSITHPTPTNEAKTQENTEDFYETKSDNMNVDEEPNVNPTYTENKPSAPSAIEATAASTIAGTEISANDTIASKLGYNGNTVTTDAKATDKEGASIGEETKSSTPSVGDYEKFGGSGTSDVSKMTGTEKGTEGVDFVTDHNTGASEKDYLVKKISPGDEGKPLLEVFSEVMHKPKEEFPEKVAENMDKITESPAVTKRLGTDERGYERDEDESFGTDGGSLTGGSFGGAGMESPAVSKMGEQVKEHDAGVMHKTKEEFPEKVAEDVDKVTELPKAATRLGTDERGYERDEGESFGTDGGSFGAAGMESPAVSKIGEQVKEHDARVMLEKVAENKVNESPEVAARLGTDEPGYERDEDESFGTDGGSLTGGSFGGAGMESPAVSKMGEQVKEHDAGVMHKPKEELPEKVAENVDKVTELPKAATRLGTDERGYERDEGESFGTDGGSFGAAGMESPAVSKIGEQVKEHDARVMPEKVAENKATESPEVAARLGTDEPGYERDEDDSFGTAPISTGGGLESPTASVGMVDRAKGLVNYYWYGNEAKNGNETAVKPDDDVHKVADGGAEEKKQDESHETSTTGVVGHQ